MATPRLALDPATSQGRAILLPPRLSSVSFYVHECFAWICVYAIHACLVSTEATDVADLVYCLRYVNWVP